MSSYKLLILFIFFASGCSGPTKINTDRLSSLSNDELCKSLGENMDNGALILKLHNEVEKRHFTPENHERCYALEKASTKSTSISIEPTVTPSSQETVYDTEKKRYIKRETGDKVGISIHIPD